MKNMRILLTSLMLFSLILIKAPSAFALFELRGHFGTHQVATGLDSTVYPELKAIPAFGADFILDLPLMPIGFGVRYEQLGGKVTSSISGVNTDLELKSTRTSLVINKRLFDTVLFVGLIGTYGLSHSNTFSLSGSLNGATVAIKESPTTDMSYTIGVEGGVRLLGILVGAEIGQMGMSMKKVGDLQENISMNGSYMKVMAGIGF